MLKSALLTIPLLFLFFAGALSPLVECVHIFGKLSSESSLKYPLSPFPLISTKLLALSNLAILSLKDKIRFTALRRIQ